MSSLYTKNFKVSELACKCEGLCDKSGQMSLGFMIKVQKIRELVARPMRITSAYRCEAHNEAVGGSKTSYHRLGRAIDIECTESDFRADLIHAAYKAGCYGVGLSGGFVHIDDRPFSKHRVWLY